MLKKIDLINIFYIILPLVFSLFLFSQPLTSFFSQDDFYHLRQVMDKSISDVPSFFIPAATKEQTFYRPLGREVYNFFMINIFGVKPLAFHLVNLFFIILNCFLAGKFINLFFKDRKIIIFTSILYIASAVHSIELYYLSSIQTLISTFFVLLGLIAFKQFLGSEKISKYILSLIFFVLAILSHESSAAAIPLIVLMNLSFYKKKRKKKKNRKIGLLIFPFLVVFGVRVVIHFYFLGLPDQTQYIPVLSPISIANTFIWFTLWCFGLPEMMVDFVTLRFQINPNLFVWYGGYVKFVFSAFTIMIPILIFLVVSFRKKVLAQETLLFLSFYLLSLSPFLLFPFHKFVYYLTLPLIWFCVLVAIPLSYAWQSRMIFKVLSTTFVTLYLLITFKTIEVNKVTHWSAKRAEAARYLLTDFMNHFPKVDKNSTFYFEKDENYPVISPEWGSSSKQAFYILSGPDALQLMYKDNSIKVYYEDMDPMPIERKNIIFYTPKFPY